MCKHILADLIAENELTWQFTAKENKIILARLAAKLNMLFLGSWKPPRKQFKLAETSHQAKLFTWLFTVAKEIL